ncbi:5547_t:CDS:2 [Scutellospora calospora]|uniref:5547_t:CDS:1 n=1 Tax=Scutellospora calospora TaxID=85575 RepID=A0ACA9KMT2_9GLOM|nr:5547_t:CDS:2 [Scutellospora calospora]
MPILTEATDAVLTNTPNASIFETGLIGQPPDILNSLKRDHDLLKSLYQEFNATTSTCDRERIAKEILKGVNIHSMIEELIFYPALRDCGSEKGQEYVRTSLMDHETVKSALYELDVLLQDEGEFFQHSDLEENDVFIFFRKIYDDKKIAELGRELDNMRKSEEAGDKDVIEEMVE